MMAAVQPAIDAAQAALLRQVRIQCVQRVARSLLASNALVLLSKVASLTRNEINSLPPEQREKVVLIRRQLGLE